MSTLTIRTDADVDRALATLSASGKNRSEIIRAAILEAERSYRRSLMRAEAEALRDDPEDVAASKALVAEMADGRAW